MNTPCTAVWNLIKKIEDEKLRKELETAFCDFECSWKDHIDEFHTGKKG